MSRFQYCTRTARAFFQFLAVFVCLVPLQACTSEVPPTAVHTPEDSLKTGDSITYLAPATLCTIGDPRLTEISGIAPSRLRDGVYWVHNDSGGEAALFALDSTGVTLAVCALTGAVNRDWEDIASVDLHGSAWLYVGDIGDNDKKYPSVTVFRIREPEVSPDWRDHALSAAPEAASFRYPDGAQDCEALMVDPRDGSIVLLDKNGTSCGVYSAPWPGDGKEATLQRIAAFRLPFEFSFWRLVTAADLNPDTRRVVVRTYNAILEYEAPAGSAPVALFDSAAAKNIGTPGLTQAEAACYSRDGRDILTTSEGVNPPLIRIRRTR